MKRSVRLATIGTTLAALLISSSSYATQTITAAVNVPMKVNATINESGCENSPGPQITLEGEISLGAVCAKVIFSNNAKGTHTATVQRQYEVVLNIGEKITIPKQPVQGGVGGNPHIYLQFHDGNGNNLSEEAYLGRCVQGLNVSSDLLNEAIAHATVDASGCSNNRGPFITLGGDLVLSGLHARLIFRNNLKGTHTAEATADVALILEGTQIVLPKQPVRGGVGGNPLISLQFIDCESGQALDDPVLLGRCNRL